MKDPNLPHTKKIIMVIGLPGSGKTYFAKHLSEALGIPYIGSDETRKEMDAMGKYTVEDKQRVYEEMRAQTLNRLLDEKSVILDATFYQDELRVPYERLAKKMGIPLIKFWIDAPVEVIKRRVSEKRQDSEADYGVYQKLAAAFEPPPKPYLKLTSTQDNLQTMLREAINYLGH